MRCSRDNLPPDLVPEVGMTLYATGEQGQTIPGRITEVREDSVVININHPFAGKTLDYEVEIVEIQRDCRVSMMLSSSVDLPHHRFD